MAASTFPGRADDGTPGFVRDLSGALSEHFDTLVVVPRVPGSPAREVDGTLAVRRFRYFPRRWEDLAHGAILENLRARPSRWLQVLPLVVAEAVALRRAAREVRPDVLHLHWIVPQAVIAALVAPGIPRVVTTLGGDLYALDSAPVRALKRRVVSRAEAVTVMNRQMRAAVIALGADPERVHVMPMGVDLTAVRAAAGERPAPAGRTRLLFVGRLVEKKGLATLLDALDRDPASFELTVVGDGPLRRELEARAAGLPVTFRGQLGRADLMDAYRTAEIVVVPSVTAESGDQDGLPVALLEAMASGCAVVASRLPGIDEALTEDSGVLVPPGDADALAAALAVLAADAGRCQTLGAAAAERAEQFSVEQVASRYRALLDSVAADR